MFERRFRNRLNRFLSEKAGDVYYGDGYSFRDSVKVSLWDWTITVNINAVSRKGMGRLSSALDMVQGKQFSRSVRRAFNGARLEVPSFKVVYVSE